MSQGGSTSKGFQPLLAEAGRGGVRASLYHLIGNNLLPLLTKAFQRPAPGAACQVSPHRGVRGQGPVAQILKVSGFPMSSERATFISPGRKPWVAYAKIDRSPARATRSSGNRRVAPRPPCQGWAEIFIIFYPGLAPWLTKGAPLG